ncbi:uncharacterized protein LOC133832925 [Humulus lupulus]|uniref:uncharacterized protein LOC133832925 n=1 Tax=Humulus lupulus TaxID=3486 RepID=UPI002B406362|nr:uncharacterized protein LOC133832925 [Humulus lupulus]
MVDPDPEERSDSSNSRGSSIPRPDEDMYYTPRRPRGCPRGSMGARRMKQVPPPASQLTQPRPRRSNRAEATANPTAEVPTGMGNNLAPSAARNPNPDAARNNPEPNRANSGPSRPDNGRKPLSPIRHPPTPIRHPSPIQEVPRTAHRRPSCSGSRDGNRQARPG